MTTQQTNTGVTNAVSQQSQMYILDLTELKFDFDQLKGKNKHIYRKL